MIEKIIFLIKMGASIFTGLVIIFFMGILKDITAKIILLPFFLACILETIKIYNMYKENYEKAKKINTLLKYNFYVFWFVFLIVIDTIAFKEKQYLLIGFSTIFWLFGINTLIKEVKGQQIQKKKKGKKITVVLLAFCIGIVMLSVGIKNSIELKNKTENFLVTDAYYISKSKSTNDIKDKNYILNYEYIVDGNVYVISTNYSTNVTPKEGQIAKIKYNPNSPEEAYFHKENVNLFLIFAGVIFLIPAILIGISFLKNNEKINAKKLKEIIIGGMFVFVPVGMVYIQSALYDNILDTILSFGAGIIVLAIFFLTGILVLYNEFRGDRHESK